MVAPNVVDDVKSAVTNLRKVGTPEEPEGDAKIKFAVCETNNNANVPVEVMGDPVTDKMLGTDMATDVTPVLVTVIVPAPLVMEIPVPAVSVVTAGAAPVEPISNCPLVSAAVSTIEPALLTMMRLLLSVVALLVPPLAMLTSGKSLLISALNEGVPLDPLGDAKTVLVVCDT